MNLVRRILYVAAAPVLALLIAAIVSTVLLLSTGDDVGTFWSTLLSWPDDRTLVDILNQTSVFYLAGVAAAIGFKMNLFNIGVEGQYRLGFFAAAAFAGQGWLPGVLNTAVSIAIAMAVGALWAGIAGLLRVWRGVSEVISTIMLNAIAGLFVGLMIQKVGVASGVSRHTKQIPESSHVGGLDLIPGAGVQFYGLGILAIVVGVAYWMILNRTSFGFDLRATGQSETAAVASGISVKRMVVISMLLSGCVAGLMGMPVLFGSSHNYGSSFQAGLGFLGIAIALLGRNHPVGVALGALIFAFLQSKGPLLNILAGISPEIVAVTQGVIVMAVVIAYEVVRRYRNAAEQSAVAVSLDSARKQEVAA